MGATLTVLVTPRTPCLAVVYPLVPAPACWEFTLAQFTIDPSCGILPASLCVVHVNCMFFACITSFNPHFDGVLLDHLLELELCA